MPANLENPEVAAGLAQRKAIPKNVQTTTQLHLSHMLGK